jgi:hypothetical protein
MLVFEESNSLSPKRVTRRYSRVARHLIDDHLLKTDDGRTVGYATWGDPGGRPCSSAMEPRGRVWTATWR